MFYPDPFDVIVIGGGHAGTEAAMASARMGRQTLLLTHNIDTLGQMSCNPAIGGIGKGHLVKEIDAMGGLMARAVDQAGIQFRILNNSKGPAVRATRAQADRVLYRQAVRTALENQPNLMIFQQAVDDLIVENDRVVGAVTQMGLKFRAKSVVLTVGTFLDGKIHIGLDNYSGGRAGDPPAISLSRRLRELPLRVGRLKPGHRHVLMHEPSISVYWRSNREIIQCLCSPSWETRANTLRRCLATSPTPTRKPMR